MLADTETEVARLAEVALAEFVFLDLEATLENLFSLGATDGNVDGDPESLVNIASPVSPSLGASPTFRSS